MNLLLYDDSPYFGGHEVMTLHALRGLVRDPKWRLTFIYNRDNGILQKRLAAIHRRFPNLNPVPLRLPFHPTRGYKTRFLSSSIQHLSESMAQERPQVVLAIQNDLEQSSAGLLAAARGGWPVLSYIPLPHALRERGVRFGRLRDNLNEYLIHLPQGWITISPRMEQILRTRGVTQPVRVVLNGIDLGSLRILDRPEARRQLGLPEEVQVVATVGRIDFKQKGQDFFLKVLEKAKDLSSLHWAIIGDGPDREQLLQMIASSPLSGRFTWVPWTEHLEAVYGAIDCLALPSRYEGVPLPMLEAMACGIPVLGSDRDGMADWLPPAWRAPFGDTGAWVRMLTSVSRESAVHQPLAEANKEMAAERFGLERFQDDFKVALRSLAPLV